MFRKQEIQKNQQNHLFNQNSNRNWPKDQIISLTYRINELQGMMSKKMDRNQCLCLLDRKCSQNQVKRLIDQLESKIREEKNREDEKINCLQALAVEKIDELSKKLKKISINNSQSSAKKHNSTKKIKPQQLYLQSNQTMFAILIEQISKLKDCNQELQKALQARNKKMISLNNEVCRKIDKLELEIQEVDIRQRQNNETKIIQNWFDIEERNNISNKSTFHKNKAKKQKSDSKITEPIDNVRFNIMSKSIETLQEDLSNKINFKDVLPIIKQSVVHLQNQLVDLKEYIEQNGQSTQKILSHQTAINQQLCNSSKIGWWYSYESQNDFAVWNKEGSNLVPQLYQHQKQSIKIMQQGIYLVSIYRLNATLNQSYLKQQESKQIQLLINSEVHLFDHPKAIRIQKNSEIRLINRVYCQVILHLHKL